VCHGSLLSWFDDRYALYSFGIQWWVESDSSHIKSTNADHRSFSLLNLPVPFLSSALQHDWHHYYSTENYGPVGILDWIFGTDKTFKAWMKEIHEAFKGDTVLAEKAMLETLAQASEVENEKAEQ